MSGESFQQQLHVRHVQEGDLVMPDLQANVLQAFTTCKWLTPHTLAHVAGLTHKGCALPLTRAHTLPGLKANFYLYSLILLVLSIMWRSLFPWRAVWVLEEPNRLIPDICEVSSPALKIYCWTNLWFSHIPPFSEKLRLTLNCINGLFVHQLQEKYVT